METWKVKVFVSHTLLEEKQRGTAATHADNFGIQAKSPDDARAKAKEWLKKRGHRVRSVNCTPVARELLAYVFPPK